MERNDQDLEEQYVGYVFGFNEDGSLVVSSGTASFEGTWEATGTANDITLAISIPDLEDFNASWNVHEIEREGGEVEIDLEFGDDELRFESDCSLDNNPEGTNGDDSGDDTTDGSGTSDLNSVLTDGSWTILTYLDDGIDETADFSAYAFVFDVNGVVTADNGSTVDGTWSVQDSGNKLILDFGMDIPLDEFNDDWDVLLVTETRIELQDVSGGDDTTDTLIFTKQ